MLQFALLISTIGAIFFAKDLFKLLKDSISGDSDSIKSVKLWGGIIIIVSALLLLVY
jgi:hypothetical protein